MATTHAPKPQPAERQTPPRGGLRAALAQIGPALGDREQVLPEEAIGILSRLGRRGDARIRIYDANGVLIADSVRAPDVAVPERPVDPASSDYSQASGIRERLLYRVGAWLVSLRRAVEQAMPRRLKEIGSRTMRRALTE